MKLKKFTKNKKQKQILIGSIIGILLIIGGISLYRSFAMYKVEKTFDVLQGTVPDFSTSDVKLTIKVNEEEAEEIPPKTEDTNYEVIVECDKGAKGSWNYNKWQIEVKNFKKGTKCNVFFKTTSLLPDNPTILSETIYYLKGDQVDFKNIIESLGFSTSDYTEANFRPIIKEYKGGSYTVYATGAYGCGASVGPIYYKIQYNDGKVSTTSYGASVGGIWNANGSNFSNSGFTIEGYVFDPSETPFAIQQ